MAERSYRFNTKSLCDLFNIDGATILEETFEYIKCGVYFHGMLGQKHSEETKLKMSKSATGIKRPSLHKSGKIIKDGKVFEFSCLSHAAKELKISCGHLSELLSGKRKSVKGWKNAS
jgi:hypothetical protein